MTSTTTPDNDDGGASAISLSTDTDTAYCTELARRSVARAALHLGIEGMETSALDVLGSILLGYLSNVGSDIATNVEGSGRSSAHVNAYDVLNAVEGCTALAATQLRVGAASQQGPQYGNAAAAILPMQQLQNSNSQQQQPYSSSTLLSPDQERGNNNNNNSRGWEGLASFLFGPNWYSIPLEGEDINKQKKDDKKKPLSSTTAVVTGMATATVVTSNIKDGTILNGNNNNNVMNGKSTATATASGKTLPEGNSNNSTPIPRPQETGKGKGKQLANMTPPSGKKIATPPAAGGDATTNTADDEKNVSFSLERKNSKGDTIMMSTGGGGGEGNSLINSSGLITANDTMSSSTSGGRWDAPYPKEVLPFPLVTHTNPTDIANPHCLSGTNISLSMHDLAMEPEACRDGTHHHFEKKQRRSSSGSSSGTTTDYKKELAAYKLNKSMERDGKISRDVFSTKNIIWGSIPGGGVGVGAKGGNSNVNAKSDDDKKSSALGGGGVGRGPLPKLSQAKMPSYVPNFFPPYPRMEDSSISSSLPSVPTTTIMSDVMSRVSQKRKKPSSSSSSSNNDVRSSLVALGKKNAVGSSYWGSNWLDNETHDGRKEKLKSNNTAGQLTVMAGPSSSAASGRMASSSSDANNKKTGGGTTDAQVVPLTRASGSRVAKILEGSN